MVSIILNKNKNEINRWINDEIGVWWNGSKRNCYNLEKKKKIATIWKLK